MPRIVVTDADVLFGGTTRALFIQLAYADTVRLHWSPRILAEMSEPLVQTGRKPSMAAALAHERLMHRAVPAAMVEQASVDRHEPAMRAYVRDRGDAHVAACAYELATGGYYADGRAVVLSTRNLRDYRRDDLARLGIDVMPPDVFLTGLPLATVAAALRRLQESLASQPTAEQLLVRLEKDGNPQISAALGAGLTAGRVRL